MTPPTLEFHPDRPCQTAAEQVGREALAYHAFGRLGTDNVQSFVLIGTAKTGKTSFLNYLCQPEVLAKHLEEPEKYLFIYLDAKTQKLENETVFFQALYTEASRLMGLTGLTDINDLPLLTEWLESQDRRLVVMVDNFNLIVSNPQYRVSFYEGLRSWFSNHKPIGCVLSSPMQLLQLSMAIELSGSPFFNIFATYLLEPLRPAEARALLTQRLAGPLREREEEISLVINAVGPFPYLLQQAGRCWTRLAQNQVPPPLATVLETTYQACRPYYEELYKGLKNHQKAVIGALLDSYSSPPDSTRIDRGLIDQGWISEDGKRITSQQLERFFRERLGIAEKRNVWQRVRGWWKRYF